MNPRMVESIDDFLKALAEDGLTLKVRERTEEEMQQNRQKELTAEQKQEAIDGLTDFYESIKHEIGNHIYGGTIYALGAVELHIGDAEETTRFNLKQKPMVVEGKEVEESCDRCYHRLTCVTQEQGLCDDYDDELDDDEQVDVVVRQRLDDAHDLGLNRDVLISHLKKHGFQPQPVFEGSPYLLETTWFKDTMKVCF